jgi:hypothetical protein
VACFEVLVAENTYNEGEGVVVRPGHLIAVVRAFLIGCVVLLIVVGCSGTSSEGPKEQKQQGHAEQGHTEVTKEQGHTEASNTEKTRSPEATESEEARCEGTRTYHLYDIVYSRRGAEFTWSRTGSEEDMKKAEKKARHIAKREDLGVAKVEDFGVYTTNDLPGCPKGGLLLGTDGPDKLFGGNGEDKIRGLGGEDTIFGGSGNDVIHAGPGNDDDRVGQFSEYGDDVIYGGDGNDWMTSGGDFGEDVLYGGDGRDKILAFSFYDHQPDKLYCGKGKDYYDSDKHDSDKHDYVDSSCEGEYGQYAYLLP